MIAGYIERQGESQCLKPFSSFGNEKGFCTVLLIAMRPVTDAGKSQNHIFIYRNIAVIAQKSTGNVLKRQSFAVIILLQLYVTVQPYGTSHNIAISCNFMRGYMRKYR